MWDTALGEKDFVEVSSCRTGCLASSSPYSWIGKMISPNSRTKFPITDLDLLHSYSSDPFPAHIMHL